MSVGDVMAELEVDVVELDVLDAEEEPDIESFDLRNLERSRLKKPVFDSVEDVEFKDVGPGEVVRSGRGESIMTVVGMAGEKAVDPESIDADETRLIFCVCV